MSGSCNARTVSKESLPAAEELHVVLSDLVRLCQFRDRSRICCHDVSPTQAHAIEVLARESPVTLNDLAEALRLDKSTTSRVVSVLERKGYVERQQHPEDARAVLLRVTASGRRLHRRIHDGLVAEAARLLEGMEPELRRGVISVMMKLADRIATCTGVSRIPEARAREDREYC